MIISLQYDSLTEYHRPGNYYIAIVKESITERLVADGFTCEVYIFNGNSPSQSPDCQCVFYPAAYGSTNIFYRAV